MKRISLPQQVKEVLRHRTYYAFDKLVLEFVRANIPTITIDDIPKHVISFFVSNRLNIVKDKFKIHTTQIPFIFVANSSYLKGGAHTYIYPNHIAFKCYTSSAEKGRMAFFVWYPDRIKQYIKAVMDKSELLPSLGFFGGYYAGKDDFHSILKNISYDLFEGIHPFYLLEDYTVLKKLSERIIENYGIELAYNFLKDIVLQRVYIETKGSIKAREKAEKEFGKTYYTLKEFEEEAIARARKKERYKFKVPKNVIRKYLLEVILDKIQEEIEYFSEEKKLEEYQEVYKKYFEELKKIIAKDKFLREYIKSELNEVKERMKRKFIENFGTDEPHHDLILKYWGKVEKGQPLPFDTKNYRKLISEEEVVFYIKEEREEGKTAETIDIYYEKHGTFDVLLAVKPQLSKERRWGFPPKVKAPWGKIITQKEEIMKKVEEKIQELKKILGKKLTPENERKIKQTYLKALEKEFSTATEEIIERLEQSAIDEKMAELYKLVIYQAVADEEIEEGVELVDIFRKKMEATLQKPEEEIIQEAFNKLGLSLLQFDPDDLENIFIIERNLRKYYRREIKYYHDTSIAEFLYIFGNRTNQELFEQRPPELGGSLHTSVTMWKNMPQYAPPEFKYEKIIWLEKASYIKIGGASYIVNKVRRENGKIINEIIGITKGPLEVYVKKI
jgi:hypothetical protein